MSSHPLYIFDAQRHIHPQVGQIVHYWPLQCEKTHDHNQPFRADICHINPNGSVNLVIYNEIGIASRRSNVPLHADGRHLSGEASMFPISM
jgi:hypothetical protein